MRRTHRPSRELVRALRGSTVWFRVEVSEFTSFCKDYISKKFDIFSRFFEGNKNTVVKGILIKRGKSNRIFLHISVLSILTVGVVISPLLSDSNPFSPNKSGTSYAQEIATTPAALESQDVFQTSTNDKLRTKILTYKVQKGDTVSTIAKKFDISEDTIKWANDLKSDNITVGDELKILPVTGISHKVESGDTVYSIAKKYDGNSQSIVDFPGNDFANPQTFSLVVGSIVVVPDGVKPEEKPTYVRPQRYLAQTPGSSAVSSGGFAWPAHGTMNQYFSWFHPGIDVGMPSGTPLVAAHSGTVDAAYTSGWHGGYGIHVIIRGDNGYVTLYAHMSGVNVAPGDKVVAGKTLIGWSGNTGRSTGPHLHFEIRGGSGNLNPLSFLQ